MSKQKKTDTNQKLEAYFQTENEHYNSTTFKIYRELIKENLFDDPELPLRLFDEQLTKLVELAERPIEAIDQLNRSLEEECQSDEQKYFVLDSIKSYMKYTEFDKDTHKVEALLNVEYEKYDLNPQPNRPFINDLREKMKTIMYDELDKLPETLESLKPKERLLILSKFLPFVFPKVKNVHHSIGENSW